ncbi:MAG: phosphodiester glycosidase family protein [Ignavibacteriales bacterium]|nr:phosphodiester glycosidase family protein [Ignavibacteriales bacterium]
MKNIFAALLLIAGILNAQSITWQDVTSAYTLPQGVKIYHGTRPTPALQAWYLDVDLTVAKISVRPYIAAAPMTVQTFAANTGAYAAINGGFFGGTSSLSAVIYPNEAKAVNIQSVTRNALTYPVMRGFFGMKNDRSCSVDWIYHFGNTIGDIYTFASPLSYINNDPTPKPVPVKANGTAYSNLLIGIGGGPVLIKGGVINVTYDQEIMWGSGVGFSNNDPRTAVGSTSNNHVIMFVADGRQAASEGVGLPELAQIMKNFGCVEALNLDGGGSTQMAIGNQYVNTPSEQRAVPAILAIVHADSMNIPKEPLFQKIIDTGDTNATAVGGGWFESANPGYWGSTKAQLHSTGSGNTSYEFRPHLPARAMYNVYGWWVASSNRCTDTPFILQHQTGTDTLRADQTANGSTWKFIGTAEFSGTSRDKVIISDAAKNGSYVVADAVKFESFDPAVITSAPRHAVRSGNPSFQIHQNFPNPFNPSTTIRFTLSRESRVSLKVFNILGADVAQLINGFKPPGEYSVTFDASRLPSGIYFYQLTDGERLAAKHMVLTK